MYLKMSHISSEVAIIFKIETETPTKIAMVAGKETYEPI